MKFHEQDLVRYNNCSNSAYFKSFKEMTSETDQIFVIHTLVRVRFLRHFKNLYLNFGIIFYNQFLVVIRYMIVCKSYKFDIYKLIIISLYYIYKYTHVSDRTFMIAISTNEWSRNMACASNTMYSVSQMIAGHLPRLQT